MLRSRGVFFAVLAAGSVITLTVSCLSDPRENDSVHVVNSCDLSQLSADPHNPQSTLRAYVTATDELLKRATDVEAQMRDACNSIDTELGLPTGGDAQTACKPIAGRVTALAKQGAALSEPPPGSPYWAELRFAPNCAPNPKALTDCVAACAGACDASKCDPAKAAGKCDGDCGGSCTTQGTAIACNGLCIGDVPVTGAPTTCDGQCNGVCTGPTWSGQCKGACAGMFIGVCGGTCTGKCDDAPINVTTSDAGVDGGGDAGAEAGGGGGGGGGGPPPLSPPPTNADGNCKGTCVGQCSSNGDGSCFGAPCLDFSKMGPPGLAPFSGGACFSGLCAGDCVAGNGTGATTTCNGTCVANKAKCDGVCHGPCTGNRTDAFCEGTLKCGQNSECENACEARAQLATTCDDPKFLEVYGVTDPALRAAFQKYGAKLAKAVSQLELLRTAYGYIGSRAYGDFVAIGLQGDLARACVAHGNDTVAAANTKLTAAIAADPTVRKFQ